MAIASHFLLVQKPTPQSTDWVIHYDHHLVGTLRQSPGWNQDFNFEWSCTSCDLAVLDSFALRPQKVAAIGNRYEVYSTTTGDLLATVKDHKWNVLGLVAISCESIVGQLRMCETLKSKMGFPILSGIGEFKIKGPFPGAVTAEQGFGQSSFEVTLYRDEVDIAQVNAVILGCMIVLTRSMARKREA